MAGILIIAHAPLASALQEFTRHVFGEVPDRLKALDVMAHEDAKVTLERTVEAAHSVISNKGLLVLTDSSTQKAMHGGQQGIIPIGHLTHTDDNKQMEVKD